MPHAHVTYQADETWGVILHKTGGHARPLTALCRHIPHTDLYLEHHRLVVWRVHPAEGGWCVEPMIPLEALQLLTREASDAWVYDPRAQQDFHRLVRAAVSYDPVSAGDWVNATVGERS